MSKDQTLCKIVDMSDADYRKKPILPIVEQVLDMLQDMGRLPACLPTDTKILADQIATEIAINSRVR